MLFNGVGQPNDKNFANTLFDDQATTAIQNVGGRQATAIQIAFPLRPRALRIEPPLKYEESTLPGGEYLVELSTLAPKEWIAVNALWEGFSFLPIYVRSAAGPAVEQPLQLQRVLPLWVRVLLWGLLLLGTWTAIYWALRVLALPYLRVWIR